MRFFSFLSKKRKPVRPADRPARRPSTKTPVVSDNDRPWQPGDRDELGRQPFAARIAETIACHTGPDGLVVGVFGAWGEGKTSLLRMVEQSLLSRGQVATLWFNPWYFRGQDTLLRSFFSQLAAKLQVTLKGNADQFTRVLNQYGDLLSALPSGTHNNDSSRPPKAPVRRGETDVEAVKKRLEGFVEVAATEFVVFVDDIDRLETPDLHDVLKLVTLVGELPHVTYVLAFDDAIVTEAIAREYGGGAEAAKCFLEKMVQVPLRLPQASSESLVRVTLHMLDRALAAAGVQWTEAEAREFQRYFVPLFASRPRTIRIGKRLASAVSFVLPLLRGEARLVDLLLIESLRVLLPDVHAALRREKDLCTRGPTLSDGSPSAARAQEWQRMLASIPPAERANAVELLEHLFPVLRSVTADGDRRQSEDDWERDQRVVSEHYFDRYFAYAVSERDVSDTAFDAVLRQLSAGEIDPARQRFDELLAGASADRLIRKLTIRGDQLSAQGAATLFRLVCAQSGDLSNAAPVSGNRLPEQQGLALAHRTLLRLPAAERGELVTAAMRESASLRFATALFQRARYAPNAGEPRTLTAEDEARAGAVLAERLDARFRQQPFYLSSDETAHLMLHVWKHLVGSERAMAAMRARLTAKPQESGAFLMAFTGKAWTMESSLPAKRGFDMEQYRAAVAFVDPAIILKSLVTAYGPYVETGTNSDAEPGLFGLAPDVAIGRQFAWLHRRAYGVGS